MLTSNSGYYQYFCGETFLVSDVACNVTELVHFCNRIGESGIELILKENLRENGKGADEYDVNIDTTMQEKNITFSTDSK